jgi:serine phosphatase RsbU (regulator of sigma subunit)
LGIDRLQLALREHAFLAAAELIARLHAAVRDFAGGTQQDDDLTAAVIKPCLDTYK